VWGKEPQIDAFGYNFMLLTGFKIRGEEGEGTEPPLETKIMYRKIKFK